MSKSQTSTTGHWVPINRPIYAKFTTPEGNWIREVVLAWRIKFDQRGKAFAEPDIVGIEYLGHTGDIVSCPINVEWGEV